MYLASDFVDYYDTAFHGNTHPPDGVFIRRTTMGPDRLGLFTELQKAGLSVPYHGSVEEIVHFWNPAPLDGLEVVVYADPRAHAGCGKIRCLLSEVAGFSVDQPNTLCSLYIEPGPLHITEGEGRAWSMRHLQVGDLAFGMVYISDDAWRSNCGTVRITEPWMRDPEKEDSFGSFTMPWPELPYPLYAVDFVAYEDRSWDQGPVPKYAAVDLNLAPGMRDTGMERLLPPKEAVATIHKRAARLIEEGTWSVDAEMKRALPREVRSLKA